MVDMLPGLRLRRFLRAVLVIPALVLTAFVMLSAAPAAAAVAAIQTSDAPASERLDIDPASEIGTYDEPAAGESSSDHTRPLLRGLFGLGLIVPIVGLVVNRRLSRARGRGQSPEAEGDGPAESRDQVFVNSARRAQILIGRQIALLENIRSRSNTADVLDDLAAVAALAQQLRRNVETALLLGDVETTRRLAAATPLSDIVRGALKGIEDYERVELVFPEDATVKAEFVLPVSHLIAELVANAAQFSEGGTRIAVAAAARPSGVAVCITDSGVGMTDEELSTARGRIMHAPSADASSHQIGLFLVGRLAARLDAQVRLDRGADGGTVATVDLPPALFEPVAAAETVPRADVDGARPAIANRVSEAEAELAMSEVPDWADLPAPDVADHGPTGEDAPRQAVADAVFERAADVTEVPAWTDVAVVDVPEPVAPTGTAPAVYPPTSPAYGDDVAFGDDLATTGTGGYDDDAHAVLPEPVLAAAAPAPSRVIKSHRAPRAPMRRLFQRRQRQAPPGELAGGERRTARRDRRAAAAAAPPVEAQVEVAVQSPDVGEPRDIAAEPELPGGSDSADAGDIRDVAGAANAGDIRDAAGGAGAPDVADAAAELHGATDTAYTADTGEAADTTDTGEAAVAKSSAAKEFAALEVVDVVRTAEESGSARADGSDGVLDSGEGSDRGDVKHQDSPQSDDSGTPHESLADPAAAHGQPATSAAIDVLPDGRRGLRGRLQRGRDEPSRGVTTTEGGTSAEPLAEPDS